MVSGHRVERTGPLPTCGRRCYLTVLFSDVCDSSRRAEELEAEEYAALLGAFRRLARQVVLRHGGVIARLQGDGVLALFGVEGSNEDDGRRATEAALELHATVSPLRAGATIENAVLQLHSGIHAGLVLLLEGDIELGRFDVVGEVPNTAARLCSMAAPDEILVSGESLGPQEHFFQTEWKRRVAVRGRRTTLDVAKVLAASEVRRRIDAAARRGVVPFVGRDDVLAVLLEAAAVAGAGDSRASSLIHLSGEPGVGKTRLLDEFLQRLDREGFFLVQGYCEGYLGAAPLQPFLHGLRVAVRVATGAGQSLEGAGALADALRRGATEGGSTSQGESASVLGEASPDAVVALLRLLAAGRPTVLVLDDWQWADDASRKVLHRVLARLDRLLVVLSARRGTMVDEPLMRQALTIEIRPLDAASAEQAIRAWLPGADEFLVQDVSRRCGGSPLFLEELCHAALAGGDLASAPLEGGVPWINAMVASRLERLPGELVESARFASVIGNVVPRLLWRNLLGPQAADVAQQLVAHDFLVPMPESDALRFRHTLTRDAVYATVDAATRIRWHLRVAQTMEADDDGHSAIRSLEAMAYHYHAAQRSEQAARFAVEAGDRALAAVALDRARALYLTALHALDALPMLSRAMQRQWCAIAQRLGQTCVFDPLDMHASAPMFERAVHLAEEAQDVNALARAEYWMAYVNYGRGRPREAVRLCRAALGHARDSGDTRLEAQLQGTLGQSLVSAGRYDEGLPLLALAVESKRQQSRPGSGTAIGSAYCLARMGYTYGDLGRFAEAYDHLEQALELLGDAEHSLRASVLELYCSVYLWHGRWEEARDAGFAGADVALRCRSRYLTAMGRALGGCAVWALEGTATAYRALRDASYLIDTRGGAVSTSLNFGWLLDAAVTLRFEHDIRQHVAGLMQRARQQDRHGHPMGCRALARRAAERGDLASAMKHLANAERSAMLRGSSRERALNDLERARLACRTGTVAEARARLEQSCVALERMGMRWHLMQASQLASSL
jgi:class 3 adenylate cyclase/tetratricopeptide (TPR) repeat protein